MPPSLQLDASGRFLRAGKAFLPVGVDYRPATDVADGFIDADLGAIAALGLNAVRVRSAAERDTLLHAGDHGLAIFCDETDLPGRVDVIEFSARPDRHVLGFDGLGDPFFHSFLPFAVRSARGNAPVIVGSLGIGAALDPAREAAWLRAALPATCAAGAAAFFWNELRGPDGLLELDGRVRPGRESFVGLARERVPPETDQASLVGLFFPRRTDEPAQRRLLLAHYFLGAVGHGWRPVRSLDRLQAPPARLLIAGVPVTPEEFAALADWVEQGGELFWHGPDPLGWDDQVAALLGARPIDWRSGRGISVSAFGERFTLAHFPGGVRAELLSAGATVIAKDHQGHPLLLEHRCGRGRVRYALPIVEDAIAPVAAHPASRDRWASWYRGMLAEGTAAQV